VVADERGARYRIGDRTLAFDEVAGAPVRAAVGGGRGAGVDGTATEGESPEEGRGGATARGGVAAADPGEAAGRRDEVIGG
jgi:hypothetical protein